MTQASTPPLPKDGEFCQLFCFRIDMAGSEKAGRELGPAGMGELLKTCQSVVEGTVGPAGGVVGGWQGDGAAVFFATTGNEGELIQRAESAARKVLDQLAEELPERRFRVGAATGRGRFWDSLGRISEDCVVLAARLESDAKARADGSALLIPSSVHAFLEEATRRLYHDAGKREEEQLYVYCPKGSRPIATRDETKSLGQPPGGELGFEMIDPAWPWAGKSDLYYALAAVSSDDLSYSKDKHKAWIQRNYLELPLGRSIFEEESLRDGWLRYNVAENRKDPPIQTLKFNRKGSVIFGDAGLSGMAGWQTAFYPQAMLKPIRQFLNFTHGYYAQAHGYSGQVFVRVGVINVAGRDRLLGEHVFGVNPWKFDRNLLTGQQFKVEELPSASAAKALYDALVLQSELDPQVFGLPIPGRDGSGRAG